VAFRAGVQAERAETKVIAGGARRNGKSKEKTRGKEAQQEAAAARHPPKR